jgi:hypothetical protein
MAPTLAATETSRRLSVEAYVLDAAGWLIDVARQEIDIVRDATPPAVVGPPSIVSDGTASTVRLDFTKALDPSTGMNRVRVLFSGNDGAFGTADDFEVQGLTLSVNDASATINFAHGLAAGSYRVARKSRAPGCGWQSSGQRLSVGVYKYRQFLGSGPSWGYGRSLPTGVAE